MADGSGSPPRQSGGFDVIAQEMRRIYPDHGPKRSEALRTVRQQNQARFDAAMRARQRPNRVS